MNAPRHGNPRHRLATATLVAAAALLSCAPTVHADPIDDAIAVIGGVPATPGLSFERIHTADAPRLALIMTASDEKIDQLLTADSRSKSAAIMILDARGRVNALAAQAALLDSTEPAIPVPVRAALTIGLPEDQNYKSRTLGRQVAAVFERWFGFIITSRADFEAKVAGVTDFNTLAGPWLHRLQRNKFTRDETERTSIKQSILALNPETAWIVIAEASGSDDSLSPAEASAMLHALPEPFKAALRGTDPINSPDPRYRSNEAKEVIVNRCRTRARAILTPAAPN